MKSTIPEERRRLLLEAIDIEDVLRTSEFAIKLRVSEMTVRRDIHELDREQRVRKIRGGAMKRYKSVKAEEKLARGEELTSTLAMAAADIVEPSMVVGVQAGRVAAALLRSPAGIQRITIVTNSVSAAKAAGSPPDNAESQHQRCFLTPGTRQGTDAIVGPMAVAMLTAIHTDIAFLSVSGPAPKVGFASETLEQVQISEAFAANTKKSVVIFDQNSGEQIDAFRVGGFAHADVIVRPALVSDQARDLCNEFADSIIEA